MALTDMKVFNSQLQTAIVEKLTQRSDVFNAASAILLSLELGVEIEKVKSSLASFKGVKRRFEYKFCWATI